MMMIVPNSLVRQKEEAQRRRRKRQEVKETKTRQELRRQTRTLPPVQLSLGCHIRGTPENMDGGVGFHFTGEAEGARD